MATNEVEQAVCSVTAGPFKFNRYAIWVLMEYPSFNETTPNASDGSCTRSSSRDNQ